MIKLNVKADIKKVTKYLTKIQRKQIPFATSQALNTTAFEMRKNVQKGMAKDLDRPTPFTIRGVMVRKAKKSHLTSEVFIAPIQAEYLKYQIGGGTRSPKSSVIVIGVGKRNKFGNTPGLRNLRTRLLAKKNTFEATINGTSGIWKRKGKKGALVLMALYTTTAHYQKRFRFIERAAKTAKARFPINFNRALTKALATAR